MSMGIDDYEKYRQKMHRFSSILTSESNRYSALEKIIDLFVPSDADACIVSFVSNQFPKIVAAVHEKHRAQLLNSYTPSEKVLRERISTHLPQLGEFKSGIEFPLCMAEKTLGTIRFYSLKADAFDDIDTANRLDDFSRWIAFAAEKLCHHNLLNESVQDCNVFIAMLSHEIRNPLTCLRINNRLMKHYFDPKAPKSFSIDRINSLLCSSETTIEKISKIAENMQNTVTVQQGEIRLEPQDFALNDLINDVIQLHSQDAHRAGCEIRWSTRNTFNVRLDRLRIEQILNNILENAIKYGAGKPIRLETIHFEDRVQISVSDEGIGIDPEQFEKIFECYERGSATKGSSPGFGMGLFIAKQLAKAHGGDIRVESKPGAGSSFFIELPSTV